MSSPLSHSLVNLSLYLLSGKPGVFFNKWKYLFYCLFVGLLSDIDMVFIIFGANLNFHRSITHSLIFAFSAAFIVSLFFRNSKILTWKSAFRFFIILTLGHLFIDYMTIDNLPPAGIQLFWPFSGKYFQSKHTIFYGIPWETLRGLLSLNTLYLLLSECIFCLPLVLLAVWTRNKRNEIAFDVSKRKNGYLEKG